MDLEPYDLRDPATLIADVADRIELRDNTATLCLVKHPSTTQELVRTDRLLHPAILESWKDASDELREMIRGWELPYDVPTEHLAVLVLSRRGRCVFTRKDAPWFSAVRYSNHNERVYGPDELLVTEHGWLDFMTDHAGLEPSLVA